LAVIVKSRFVLTQRGRNEEQIMADTVEADRPRDDAPVTASKQAKGDRALIGEAVTINRPAQALYDVWRQVENLAEFMDNIERIERIDDTRSRWRVKAPAGKTVEWESVIIDDQPGRSITWQSAQDAAVANSGKVEFIDAGARGTIVRAVIAYDPPAGIVGQLIAKLFQREPRLQTRRDLRRFKQLMETGEIATAARTRAELVEEQEG
jgi:uncharacterized membrane protein